MEMKHLKKYLIVAALFCVISIVFGAFGAHFVKSQFGPGSADTMGLSSDYFMIHGLAMIAIISATKTFNLERVRMVMICFIIGTILFSGSLAFLSFKAILSSSFIKVIGPVTPIGGLFLIAGWVLFLKNVIKMS